MRSRTAVALVVSPVLLLAAPFAFVAWAFAGPIGLLAFVAPLALLVALVAALAVLTRQVVQDEESTSSSAGPGRRLRKTGWHQGSCLRCPVRPSSSTALPPG